MPLIIKFPGKIKGITKISEPVVGTDIYPTILDFLDLPLIPDQHMDGESVNPLIKWKKFPKPGGCLFHFPHYHHQFHGTKWGNT